MNQARRSAAWRKNQTPSGRYATRSAFRLCAGTRPWSVLRLLPSVSAVIYFNFVSTLCHLYIYLCWNVLMWTGYANTYNKNWWTSLSLLQGSCRLENFCNLRMFFHATIWTWTLVQHQASVLDQIAHFLVFRDNWTTKNLAVAFGWMLQVLRRPFISHNGSRPCVGSEVIGEVCQEAINHGYATTVTVASTVCVEGIKGCLYVRQSLRT